MQNILFLMAGLVSNYLEILKGGDGRKADYKEQDYRNLYDPEQWSRGNEKEWHCEPSTETA